MSIKVFDRVKETSISSGSGNITLAGAVAGFQSFGSVLSSGDQTYYTLVNGNNWEVGLGTYLNNSLTRDSVFSSSNGGQKLTLSGNTSAFITYPAEVSVHRNENFQVIAGTGGIIFNDGSILTSASVSSTGSLPSGGANGQILSKLGSTNYVAQWVDASSIVPTGLNATSIANGTVSNTEFQYLDGLTSGIQGQLNLKANTASLTGYYSATNPSGYIVASSLSPYYLASNPSGFITTGNLSTYVQTNRTLTINGAAQDLSSNRTWTVGDVFTTGSYSNPSWINNIAWAKVTGTPTTVAGYGMTDAATTGQLSSYYLNSNPSGYITNASLTGYYSVTNPSGFITSGALSPYYLNNNPSGFVTSGSLSVYYLASNPSGFITSSALSPYYLNTNPSGYVTSAYVSGYQPLDADLTSLAAASGTGIYYRSASNTWSLITIAQPLSFTGGILTASGLATSGDLASYYLNNNPSGYISSTGVANRVPYVGATGNLTLGVNSVQANSGIFSSGLSVNSYLFPATPGISGQVLTTNGSNQLSWANVSSSGGGSGISSLNGLISTIQTFSVSTTGVDFNINSAGANHVFSIPDAGSGVRGVVSTGTQIFYGDKSFDSSIIFTNASSGIINTTSHLRLEGNQSVALYRNGTQYATVGAGYFGIGANSYIGFISNNNYSTTPDMGLYWDAADTLGLRDGINPQCFAVYNTWTNSGNWEGAVFDWKSSANTFRFGTSHGTSGSDRAIEIIMGGSGVHRIETNGNHLFRSNGGAIVTGAGYAYSFQSNATVTWMQITNSLTSANTHGAFFGLNTNEFDLWNFQGGGIRLYTSSGTGTGQNTFSLSNRGYMTHAPIAGTGSPTLITITGPAHTGLASGSEATDILVNLGRTVQFSSGNIGTQRSIRIVPPTLSFIGSGVVTSGATLSIAGPPVAGSGCSITNSYALLVESGRCLYSFANNTQGARWMGLNGGPAGLSLLVNSAGNGSWSLGLNSIADWVSDWGGRINAQYGQIQLDTLQGNSTFTGTAGGWAFTNNYTGPLTITASGIASVNIEGNDIWSQRRSTNPQTFRLFNTFTSTGNFESIQIKAKTTQYEIGSIVGSGGGVNRNIVLGHTNSSGIFSSGLIVSTGLTISIPNGLTLNGYTFPTTAGSSGTVLTTNGLNQLSWSSVSGTSSNPTGIPSGIAFYNSLGNLTSNDYIKWEPTNKELVVAQGLNVTGGNTAYIILSPSDVLSGGFIIQPFSYGPGFTYDFNFYNYDSGGYQFYTTCPTDATFVLNISQYGTVNINSMAAQSGSPVSLNVIPAENINVNKSTPDIWFNLNRVVRFASGNSTSQSAVIIDAPTYSINSTGIISSGATLSISGPPLTASGCSITNAYSLVIKSGSSYFGGNVIATGLLNNGSELTYSPSGSFTLPLAKNHQTLNLISATGNPTITIQTPTNSSAGTLIVKQGTTSRNITWGVSTGVLVWLGTQPTWSSDPTGCYRIMTWRYNPSLLTTFLAVTESGA